MPIWIFIFQAEDGIRDLGRSRVLGDVYKRQNVVGGSISAVTANDNALIRIVSVNMTDNTFRII